MDMPVEPFGEKGRATLASWSKREDAFFKTIGVNQLITTYGQAASSSNPVPFDYSIEDMGKVRRDERD